MADNETSADIIAEMETERPGLMNAQINTNNSYYARRLKAALKRERGDCAKLREAMARIRSEAYECDKGGEYLGEGPDPGFDRIIKMCDAALATTSSQTTQED